LEWYSLERTKIVFRRVWYYLRDLVWTAILAALFIIAALVVAVVFQEISTALVLAVCGTALAVLSTRS
jgi:hypothetical protein